MNENNNVSCGICPVCNNRSEPIFVHGHYQCPVCKQVVISCCDGGEIKDKTKNPGRKDIHPGLKA